MPILSNDQIVCAGFCKIWGWHLLLIIWALLHTSTFKVQKWRWWTRVYIRKQNVKIFVICYIRKVKNTLNHGYIMLSNQERFYTCLILVCDIITKTWMYCIMNHIIITIICKFVTICILLWFLCCVIVPFVVNVIEVVHMT